MQKLYNYFLSELSEGKIDFSVRAELKASGDIEFYIHPDGKDGDTLDVVIPNSQAQTKKPDDGGEG